MDSNISVSVHIRNIMSFSDHLSKSLHNSVYCVPSVSTQAPPTDGRTGGLVNETASVAMEM